MEETKKRNNSIDIFRLICAVLVIVIHTNPFKGIKGVEFVTHQVLTRVAVPFFFAIAGFFYIQALLKGKEIFWKYLIRIFIDYICWSLFYYCITFIRLMINGEFEFVSFVKECIFNFLLTGSYYHFWFFPALIASVIIVTLFYKLRALKTLYVIGIGLYVVGCLGCAYYKLAVHVPIISTIVQNPWFETIRRIFLMGLPFFLLGGLLMQLGGKRLIITQKRQMLILLSLAVAFIVEILIVAITGIYENVTLTIFLYPLVGWIIIVLYNNPAEKLERMGRISRSCAEFIYYIHPAIILLVEWSIISIFKTECFAWLLFILVTIISLTLSVLWMKFDIKKRMRKIIDRRKK